MTKATPIDRIELTRRKFSHWKLENGEIIKVENDNHRGDICPRCGKHTLIHTEDCERCTSCGYDACAWSEV
ncbi:MAG: hypothetical protein II964_00765 [Synergistaceae bacterium]|nr:hypothetical protein [Synergistaceae bacterium]